MDFDPTRAQDEIGRLQQRSTEIAETLAQARAREVGGRSEDGLAEAVAAGGRLRTVTLTAAADRTPHDQLVAAMTVAARDALHGSNEVLQQAAAAFTQYRPGAS